MQREPIYTPCNCRGEDCKNQRLSQLHLYAVTDRDIEILELLDALFELHEANPERVAAVRKNIEALNALAEMARNN